LWNDVVLQFPYMICQKYGRQVLVGGSQTYCYTYSNSLSNKMDNSLLAARGINHKYIVVE